MTGIPSVWEPCLGLAFPRPPHLRPLEPSDVFRTGFGDPPPGPAVASQAPGSVGSRPGAHWAPGLHLRPACLCSVRECCLLSESRV